VHPHNLENKLISTFDQAGKLIGIQRSSAADVCLELVGTCALRKTAVKYLAVGRESARGKADMQVKQ
jgi:hypothetical protein